MMRGAGHVTCMKKIRNAYQILVERSEGKISLRVHVRALFRKMLKLSVAVYRIHIDQDRVQCWAFVDMIMHLKIIRRHGLDHLGDCWFLRTSSTQLVIRYKW
jgi:hypothetical protein